MRYFLLFAFLVALGCTSQAELKRQARARELVKTIDQSLQQGMSLEQVKAATGDEWNCQGSQKSVMLCTKAVWKTSGSSPYYTHTFGPPTPNLTSRDYDNYRLHFDKDKLQRWEKAKSIEYQQ